MGTHEGRPKGFIVSLAKLRCENRGVAAVEFALILPILIAFYLGMSEAVPAFSIKRKLSMVTRALADLTTRSPTLTRDELKNIFAASSAIMRPYDNAGMTQMVVSSIAVTKSGSTYTGTVEWSCGWNLKSSPGSDDLTTKTKGTSFDVPTGFQNEGSKSFVIVETRYPYTPTIGYKITGSITLKDSSPWPVRDADRVNTPSGTVPAGMTCKT